ncbi:MAG: hypothetical protein QCH31_06710 [Methanolobus sp.]|nr:hypothetical protein [Methanolobus sp.]
MMMYGYNTGSMFLGLLLNIIVILVVVWVAVTLLNRSGPGSSVNSERLARLEKDVEDIKQMVREIKEKLDDI